MFSSNTGHAWQESVIMHESIINFLTFSDCGDMFIAEPIFRM